MHTPIILLILLSVVSSAWANDSIVSLTGIDARHKGKSFPLEKAKLQVELAGPIAKTSWEMTFHNDTQRDAEGELEVPLRPECRVTGYAMDVSGRMREGVVVDSKRARKAYEEIVSRKVDPGILETTALGFKTKVFPIPTLGSKSVRVDLSEFRPTGNWQPPLPGANDLSTEWKITCRDKAAPKLTGLDATWTKQNGVWIAQGNHTLQQLQKLKITPASPPQSWVATPENNNSHKIVGTIPITKTQQARAIPKHLEIWWDGSLAGRNRDREAVITSLGHLFQWIKEGEVTLRVFRDTASKPETFQIQTGDCKTLIERLRSEPAEGMLRFNALKESANDSMTLVISEGVSPLPEELPQWAKSKSWTLLDPTNLGGQSLGVHALNAGNEIRGTTELDWSTKCTPPASIGKATTWRKSATQWIICSEIGNKQLSQLQGNVAISPIARSIWAAETYTQMRLEGKHPKQTLEFAKQEKVLSDQTAFIVLDSINDYVKYGIEPPEKSLHDLWLSKSQAIENSRKKQLTSWTERWKLWREKFEQQPADYGKRLTKALVKTASFWARHTGNGKNKVTPKEMMQLVEIQAKVANLNQAPKDLKRIKDLVNAQEQWAKLKNQVGDRFIRVNVGGHVKRPGPYELPFASPLISALQSAGGETAFGSIRRVSLYRQGKRFVYDLRKKEGMLVPLQNNDSINVPQKRWLGAGGGTPGQTPPFESKHKKLWLSGTVTLGKWSSERAYIQELQKILTAQGDWKMLYHTQAEAYGWRADYYLDVIDLLEHHQMPEEAKRIAYNFAQRDVNSPELLRRSARALNRLGDSKTAGELFKRLTIIAGDEPHAWLELARWHHHQNQLDQAISCYAKVTESDWEYHWHSAWTTAMIELNGILNLKGKELAAGKISPLRISPLSADLRVVLDRDAARSNIDLWVEEPLGELVSWGNSNAQGGGVGSPPNNLIAGHDPEEYIILHAMPGEYQLHAKFHGDLDHHNIAPVTVQAQIILNFGRENETRKNISLRLTEQKRFDLGKVRWEVGQ
jgi:Ca-activated chloride channel family protein